MVRQMNRKKNLPGLVLALLIGLASCSARPTPYMAQRHQAMQIMVKGNSLVEENDFAGGQKLYHEACRTLALINDAHSQMECYLNVALAYLKHAESAKAQQFLNETLEMAKQFRDLLIQGKALLHLGLVQIQEQKLVEATQSLEQALILLKQKDESKEFLYKAYASLGYLFVQNGKNDQAKKFLNLALDARDKQTLSNAYSSLAQYYFGIKKFTKALYNIDKAVFYDQEEVRSYYLAHDLHWRCKILSQMQKPEDSELACLHSLNISVGLNHKKLFLANYDYLQQYYQNVKMSDRAAWLTKIRRQAGL